MTLMKMPSPICLILLHPGEDSTRAAACIYQCLPICNALTAPSVGTVRTPSASSLSTCSRRLRYASWPPWARYFCRLKLLIVLLQPGSTAGLSTNECIL